MDEVEEEARNIVKGEAKRILENIKENLQVVSNLQTRLMNIRRAESRMGYPAMITFNMPQGSTRIRESILKGDFD